MSDQQAYVAEIYLPSAEASAATRLAEAVDRAADRLRGSGVDVRQVACVVLPGDEMCLLVVAAESAQVVGKLVAGADLAADRISPAVVGG